MKRPVKMAAFTCITPIQFIECTYNPIFSSFYYTFYYTSKNREMPKKLDKTPHAAFLIISIVLFFAKFSILNKGT